MLRYRPNSSQLPGTVGRDAHAHSPRRASLQCPPHAMSFHDTNNFTDRGRTSPSHQTLHPIGHTGLHQSRWASNDASARNDIDHVLRAQEDPFMGPPLAPAIRGRQTRSSSHDISMEDYVSSKSTHSRAHTEMSGVTYPPKDFGKTMQEAAIEEIIEALSPVKRDQLFRALSPDTETHAGTEPPNNTPSKKPMAAPSSTPKTVNHVPTSAVNENGTNLKILGGRVRSQGSSKVRSRPSSTQLSQRNVSPASNSTSPKEAFLTPEHDNGDSKTNIDLTIDDDNSRRRRSTSNASKRKRSISLRPANIDTADAISKD